MDTCASARGSPWIGEKLGVRLGSVAKQQVKMNVRLVDGPGVVETQRDEGVMKTAMTTNTKRKSVLEWPYCFGALGE